MNEMTTTKSNLPQGYVANEDAVLRSDILVPYLALAQASSDVVKERLAQMGDILRSTTKEKLADPDKDLDIIFLHNPKADWVIEQKEGNRFQWRRAEPRNASNEHLPWSFWGDLHGNPVEQGTLGATEWRRSKRLTVFAVLPSDIDAALVEMEKLNNGELPDPSKALTPIIVSFRVSSYGAGKEVATLFAQSKSMRTPIYKYQVKIGARLEKNDEGSFYVWNIDRVKPVGVSQKHLPVVEEWARIVTSQGSGLQVHEEGDSTPQDVTSNAPGVC